jgi:hypothetical protein
LRSLAPSKRRSAVVLPRYDGLIRRALLDALHRHNMTGYQLWKRASEHVPTLQRSAVYQFLAGKRQVQTDHAEAMMRAAGLRIDEAKRRAG